MLMFIEGCFFVAGLKREHKRGRMYHYALLQIHLGLRLRSPNRHNFELCRTCLILCVLKIFTRLPHSLAVRQSQNILVNRFKGLIPC